VFEVALRDSRTRFALRLHRPGYRSLSQIRAELAFLAAVAGDVQGTRIAVPSPVPTSDGDLVVEVELDGVTRYCDLLTWIDGRVMKHGSGLGVRSCRLLGEGLASIHETAAAFSLPAGTELPAWDADAMFTEASPFDPGPMQRFLSAHAFTLYEDVVRRTRAVFGELASIPGQHGIIHNDYVLINVLFRRSGDGRRLGVLDFDDIGFGYYLYDLAPLLGNLFDYPGAYRRLRHAFLDGYRSVRSLPSDLEAHLPVLMAARHAVTLTWLAARRRRGETDLPIDRHVEIRVAEMARCLTSR
jgi:Ser/Thr protein kinase RdoA (MazF antagonist)